MMAETLKLTVEVKATEIECVRWLLLALAGEFDQLPPNTKIRFAPFMDDLQKECDEKLQAKQVVK
ncbi:MAG: hypothetical protein ACRC7D_22520 [Aeromonas popoffii]|uniref:hypothetical protein n=1 Tax=Aeromonas popoffii TaxID=70856 RepID=UPI003F35C2DD